MSAAPFEILYSDNHLLAVNKPAGVLTQPVQGEEESLEISLKKWLKSTYHKPGNVFLGVLHRLDRHVSGVVLFARTSKALLRLNEAIRAKRVRKQYCAYVDGMIEPNEGVLEDFLCHGDHLAFVSTAENPQAKVARLHYNVLKRCPNTTYVQIDLETGRYHQIRVQFSSRGFPILGDRKYGCQRPLINGQSIALHHQQLQISHPISHEMITIVAPQPKQWVSYQH